MKIMKGFFGKIYFIPLVKRLFVTPYLQNTPYPRYVHHASSASADLPYPKPGTSFIYDPLCLRHFLIGVLI